MQGHTLPECWPPSNCCSATIEMSVSKSGAVPHRQRIESPRFAAIGNLWSKFDLMFGNHGKQRYCLLPLQLVRVIPASLRGVFGEDDYLPAGHSKIMVEDISNIWGGEDKIKRQVHFSSLFCKWLLPQLCLFMSQVS